MKAAKPSALPNVPLFNFQYRHGLRVSEVISLRWDQVELKAGHLAVVRLKNGVPSTHPLRGPELRALRQLRGTGRRTSRTCSCRNVADR